MLKALLGDTLFCIVGALVGAGIGFVLASTLLPAQPSIEMHRVDQPRCFPEGTDGVEAFPLCPDNLPTIRSA